MAEDAEKMKKVRIRMERDAYAVLVSFRDGATPRQLENKMEDTLGYTYNGKYHQGGVHDMAQLLREHPQVRQMSDGKFKILVTEEVADLVALISKQKDNKGKRRAKPKMLRPMTSTGHYRNGFGTMSARTSPKAFGGMRPMSSLGRAAMNKNNPPSAYPRPATSASFLRPVAISTSSSKEPFPSSTLNNSFKQRPMRPLSTMASHSPRKVQSYTCEKVPPVEPAKTASKTCQMPSIKEFSDTAKKMLMKIHPKAVHLSELTEFYSQEQGFVVDPLQLFSKSWKMLAITTFKDWLDLKDGEVSLKAAFVERNPITAPSNNRVQKEIKTVIDDDPPKPPFPTLQGFRYNPPKSPIDMVAQKFKCLTMGARQAVSAPTQPVANARTVTPVSVSRLSSTNSLVEDYEEENPVTLRKENIKKAEAAGQCAESVQDKKYDSRNMSNLRHVLRPPQMTMKIWNALEGTPGVKQIIKPKKSARQEPAKKSVVQSSMASPSNSSRRTVPQQIIEMISPPMSIEQPTFEPSRARSGRVATPPTLLIGKALAAVKKQDDLTPAPRRTDLSSKSRNVPPTSIGSAAIDNIWNEPACPPKSRAGSVVGRKPVLLPPMSKGAEMECISRHRATSHHQSEESSQSSSPAPVRSVFDEALNSGLPDSDKEMW